MIIHADMDAFYASVEIREQPDLAEKPVAVGGPVESRGVISAANYIARNFGVHSAMPTKTALQRCPKLILIPGRLDLYSEVSRQIHAIFSRYTSLIEPLSLDEAFLDVSASEKLFGSTELIAKKIKQDINNELKLIVSIGIAPSKFVAKIASDLDKPDGFVVVNSSDVQDFLDPLPVKRIWGVGKTANAALNKKGIYTIKQLRHCQQEFLTSLFGKHGQHLWNLAHGIDPRSVVPDHQAKSISHETTFAVDLDDVDVLLAQLLYLTEQVTWRLRQNSYKGKTINLKVRFSDFSTITRSATLKNFSHNTDLIWKTAKNLFLNKLPNPHKPIRLIGIGVSQFESDSDGYYQQCDLFESDSVESNDIDDLSDSIKDRFGKSAIKRGRSVIP